jgi:methylmalonyl-CoA/ethylmalonyl-CoA epimerase
MDDSVRGSILFDHIAVGVRDPSEVTPLLVGDLGGEPVAAGPGAGFLWYQWRFGGAGVLEILEPDGPAGGFLYRFLDSRGPGIHHVTFKVPDHAAAVDRAQRLGYDVVGLNIDDPGWKEAFLHPKQAQGIVVQFVETGPDTEDGSSETGDDPSWQRPFPPAPEPAEKPVALVGLRMVSHCGERARTQWQELLGAQCDADANSLVFRWAGSPIRIAVDIDPDRPEGPIGLEWSAEPGPAIPDSAESLLGTSSYSIATASGT